MFLTTLVELSAPLHNKMFGFYLRLSAYLSDNCLLFEILYKQFKTLRIISRALFGHLSKTCLNTLLLESEYNGKETNNSASLTIECATPESPVMRASAHVTIPVETPSVFFLELNNGNKSLLTGCSLKNRSDNKICMYRETTPTNDKNSQNPYLNQYIS